LTDRTLRATVWITIGKGLARSLDFGKVVVLTHLLTPADFGLLGVVLFAVMCLETFTETGFDQALVQRRGDIKEHLNAAWVVQILRGMGLGLLSYLSAPLVASFFGDPRIKPIMGMISLMILLRGFSNPAAIYLTRSLDFRRVFFWNLYVELTGAAVAISLAFFYRNVWALVISVIAAQLVKTILSYRIVPERPSFKLDWSKTRELTRFGRWVLGSNIIIFLLINGDDAWVGKLLGATTLGLYQLAYRISILPATEISSIVSSVTLPAYAAIQNDRQTVWGVYLRVLKLTALVSIPLGTLIAFTVEDLVGAIMGHRWIAVAPLVQVLCCYGIIRSINSPSGSLYPALGRPEITTRVSGVQLAILAILIYPFTLWWGVRGVAFAIAIACGICFLLASWEVTRLIDERQTVRFLAKIFSCLVPGTTCALILAGALLILQKILPAEWPAFYRLMADGALAVILASGISWYVYRYRSWFTYRTERALL